MKAVAGKTESGNESSGEQKKKKKKIKKRWKLQLILKQQREAALIRGT